MKQFIYKVIYYPVINKILRNTNKVLAPVLPAKIKLPPSGVLQLKNKDVNAKILTNQTNFLTREIFWEGFDNFEYTSIFIELSKHIHSFYDIGANIGYFTILAANVNPTMEITAFEPSKGPLFYLKENVKLNNLKHVDISNFALSEGKGKITFYEIQNKKYTYLEHNLAGESNTGSKTTGRNYVPVEVETITLDEYVQQKNSSRPIDLIKIDTEGTEAMILKHASKVLSNDKPIIICETLFGMIEGDLEDLMVLYGYEFYNHVPNGLQHVKSLRREIDNGVNNCFFVHPSKKNLIEQFIVK